MAFMPRGYTIVRIGCLSLGVVYISYYICLFDLKKKIKGFSYELDVKVLLALKQIGYLLTYRTVNWVLF